MAPEARLGRAFDWLFRDRQTGAITIGQRPNALLWLFLGATAAGLLVDGGSLAGRALRGLASVYLAAWAADEVLRGVTPWRRILGAGVILWLALRLGGVV